MKREKAKREHITKEENYICWVNLTLQHQMLSMLKNLIPLNSCRTYGGKTTGGGVGSHGRVGGQYQSFSAEGIRRTHANIK